jgi:molecular chaperone DnaK (HSP70)/Tfp pilus assembly protein PilZ
MSTDGRDEGQDRAHRAHPRFPVDWRVTLKLPDGRATHVSVHNASRGGLFVLTNRPPPAGSAVEITVELPDGVTLTVGATVQHVVTPERAAATGRSPGIGVKIDERHAVDILLLEQMAEAARGATRSFEPRLGASPPARPRTLGRIALSAEAAARAIGVDLGTAYTRAGCAVGDRVHLVTDAEGRGAHPSVVAFVDGAPPLAGWAARERLGIDPRRTVSGARRLLGRAPDDEDVRAWLAAATFKVVHDGVDLGDRRVAAVELCATILAHVRELAERQLRREVREAVLTVDGARDETRGALREAAAAAGLDAIALLDEPVAAALAAGAGAGARELVAVYDFGAGAFSFTLLDISGDSARVVARETDVHVSTAELDEVLADAAADAFWRATRIELREAVIPWQRLLLACEAAKLELAERDRAEVVVEGIVAAPAPIDLVGVVSRRELEGGAADLVDRSIAVCRRVLARAGVEPGRVQRLLAVGGGARLPFVREAVERLFARRAEPDVPEEAIVTGAARRAAGVIRSAS